MLKPDAENKWSEFIFSFRERKKPSQQRGFHILFLTVNLVFQELSFTASQQSLNIYVSKPVLTKTWTPKLLLESLKNNKILPNRRAILWHTFNSKQDFLLLKFQSLPFFIFCRKTDFKSCNFSSVVFGSTDFLKHREIAQYLYFSFCQKDISGKARPRDDSGKIVVRGVFTKTRSHKGQKSG